MFNLEESIATWRRQMAAGGIHPEYLQELEAHLREDIERCVRVGIAEGQAFAEAVCQLGGADALGGEFAKEHTINYRRLVVGGLAFGLGILGLSLAVCHFVVIPAAVTASEAYSRWLGFTALRSDTGEHFRFVVRCMVGVAFGCEIPVVLLTLAKMRIVDYRFLSQARKYAIITNLVLGAVFTGPEVSTQLIMFLSLQALYEFCVWTTWFWEVRNKAAGH